MVGANAGGGVGSSIRGDSVLTSVGQEEDAHSHCHDAEHKEDGSAVGGADKEEVAKHDPTTLQVLTHFPK